MAAVTALETPIGMRSGNVWLYLRNLDGMESNVGRVEQQTPYGMVNFWLESSLRTKAT